MAVAAAVAVQSVHLVLSQRQSPRLAAAGCSSAHFPPRTTRLAVTKSITRFARNTVTLLDAIRELKLLNIDVFFEKENLHSLSANGELMLTLLAMYAEEEARSARENQKWRIQKMIAEGRPNKGRMHGY